MQEPIWSVVPTESLIEMQLAARGQANRWRHTIKQAKQTIDQARWHRAFWKKQAADIQVILDARAAPDEPVDLTVESDFPTIWMSGVK